MLNFQGADFRSWVFLESKIGFGGDEFHFEKMQPCRRQRVLSVFFFWKGLVRYRCVCFRCCIQYIYIYIHTHITFLMTFSHVSCRMIDFHRTIHMMQSYSICWNVWWYILCSWIVQDIPLVCVILNIYLGTKIMHIQHQKTYIYIYKSKYYTNKCLHFVKERNPPMFLFRTHCDSRPKASEMLQIHGCCKDISTVPPSTPLSKDLEFLHPPKTVGSGTDDGFSLVFRAVNVKGHPLLYLWSFVGSNVSLICLEGSHYCMFGNERAFYQYEQIPMTFMLYCPFTPYCS